MKAFIESQFAYVPLNWMFHDRRENNKMNSLHERALRIVYKDDISSFDELLTKDKSFRIHHRNIQSLAIELYKAKHEISPLIIRNIFTARPTIARNLRTQSDFPLPQINTVHYGKVSLRYVGSIIWNMIPADIKNITRFKGVKEKIKAWLPKCTCQLCKTYIQGVGYI